MFQNLIEFIISHDALQRGQVLNDAKRHNMRRIRKRLLWRLEPYNAAGHIQCCIPSPKQLQRLKFQNFLPRNTRIPDQQHVIRPALLRKRSHARSVLCVAAFDSIRCVRILY